MSEITAEQIASRAYDLGLLDDRQLQGVWSEFGSRNVALGEFLQLLVRRELLTNYQIDRLLKDERTGFFFGNYKVRYLVGTGTFARVYRAVHKETDQVVAVKVLRKRYSDTRSQYSQFVREGQVGCTLRHPNIVPIYEVVSERRFHFLVMEFVEGRNLREFMKIRRRLDALQATQLIIDIASGLQYAYARGLTHRDLKMSNVLISSLGQAKLVDFGLAAVDDSSSGGRADADNPRTIDYAALERATGVRKDDTRSDIYFLGCMYYQMLTGAPPLAETTDRTHRLSKTRFLQVTPIQTLEPSLPNNVASAVNKAMAFDPDRRYQTPGAMLAELNTLYRRLGEGDTGEEVEQEKQEAPAPPLQTQQQQQQQQQQSIMVVESNSQMQDVFRNGFKRAGYRVLLTSDPQRAVDRFDADPDAADGILLNAQSLGQPAVAAFNQLSEGINTANVPALLLLDESQSDWRRNAKTAEHRVVLGMPITMRKLRDQLVKIVPPKQEPQEHSVD